MAESHLEFTKPSHVVGRYALYGRLAAGGMATVHLGRVLEADGTSRTVAVKRLHPQFCKDPEFVAMFIDEARLAARIKHANVVETLDILTMGQELLLVMEYIRGECFSKLLRAARRKNLEPSIGVVGRIASGMLHGLHAAHEARDDNGELLNVVHRDISPQNVMIDVDGMVKVLDFGVAKASARIQITRDGQMKGKLSYMSPEQLQGHPVDRRADVFACGVVLWEALTRRRLFVGEDASEVLRKILRDEVPPPSQWMAGSSPEVDRVVLRALSKDPEQRYQTAEELALDVERVIDLASPEEVSAWLDSVAGEILGKRQRLLDEIERLGVSDLAPPSSSAGSRTAQDSITLSDTFQRIQSWAEREAARAVGDGRPSYVSELDDAEVEPTKTIADARCVDEAPPADTTSSVMDTGLPPWPASPAPAFAPGELGSAVVAPVARPAALSSVEAVPAGTASGLVSPVQPRRERRFLYALAAAAAVVGLGAVALSVQPSILVRTHALVPGASSQAVTDGEPAREGEASPVASAKPVTGADSTTAIARPPNAPAASNEVTPSGAVERAAARELSARPSTPPGAASGEAKLRVSQALIQPAKDRIAPPAPSKKSARRAPVARRAKPASAPTPAPAAAAAKAATAAAKVDCRQPFWIDEGGIRRLKMDCL